MASETKWTPGPWSFEEIDPSDKDWGACEIWSDPSDEPVSTMVLSVDNARLIASAPELYEALDTVWAEVENSGREGATELRWKLAGDNDLFRLIRAALAKARGE